jgi:hypothetical protein
MIEHLLSLAGDPRVIGMALCVGAIWVLRWIEMVK